MKQFFNKIVAFVTWAGKTPKGKAAEHAVVAAVALAASAALTQALSGDIHGAVLLLGTAVIAGARAALKEVTK